MKKVGLTIGAILTTIGMYKIDKFLIPTLDYFGKYVFYNTFIFWSLWKFYKFNGKFKNSYADF